MKIVSPTGSWDIRNDAEGFGYFGAPRGNRVHKGLALVVEPKQNIVSPIFGNVIREAYPYAGDLKWAGCLIIGTQEHVGLEVKMFYMRLYHHIRKQLPQYGHHVFPGNPIGTAQDISNKHGAEMIPHVHLEIRETQQSLVDPEKYKEGD